METIPPPVLFGILAVASALLPVLFLLVTPFLKLSIVFGVLRTGFGSQGIPGTAALTALSLVLSFHLLEPACSRVGSILQEGSRVKLEKGQTRGEIYLQRAIREIDPAVTWLAQHSGREELEFFQRRRQETNVTLFSVVPAFVLSELRTGFQMALYLFLPFFVIDLLVTTVLTGMGMMMVNPVMISFPLKLLLFVECDGWLSLSKSLVASY